MKLGRRLLRPATEQLTVTLDQRFALEGGQRLTVLIRACAPHANDRTAIGVSEAFDRRRVLAEMCFKPLQVGC